MAIPITAMPKFTQIECGEYENSNDRLSHQLYALGEDGRVYKSTKEGWELVDKANDYKR